MRIPIDQIIPDPNQPRRTFDGEAIKELASSFDSYGVISPLKVRPYGDNQYMIIAGELRYRAIKQRGDKQIDCVVQEATDQQAREMQFIENLQRQDIPALELGQAFKEYCDTYGVSQAELARKLGYKSSDAVDDRISLVTKSSGVINAALKSGKLQFSEAARIVTIPDKKRQEEVAEPFIRGDVSSKHAPKVAELARKEPERPVDDIIGEVVYGIGKEEKEILSKPSKPTTAIDKFYELEKMANKLSDGLAELQGFPAFGKALLGIALQSLRTRIDETLERMGIQTIEGETRPTKEE